MLSLVVDDDPTIRAYVQSILHSESFETLEAEDGALWVFKFVGFEEAEWLKPETLQPVEATPAPSIEPT